jgi:hypothetical protein
MEKRDDPGKIDETGGTDERWRAICGNGGAVSIVAVISCILR